MNRGTVEFSAGGASLPTMNQSGWRGSASGGDGLASGVYFYRLTAGDFVQTRKLLLLR